MTSSRSPRPMSAMAPFESSSSALATTSKRLLVRNLSWSLLAADPDLEAAAPILLTPVPESVLAPTVNVPAFMASSSSFFSFGSVSLRFSARGSVCLLVVMGKRRKVRWLLGRLTKAQDKGIDDLVCEMHKVDE